MEDLTTGMIGEIHEEIVRKQPADDRILSEANLHQMVFHANMIPACVPRAAFAFWFLCTYPVFRERNAETALAVAELILESGGFRVTGNRNDLLRFPDSIAAWETEPADLESWFSVNVRDDR